MQFNVIKGHIELRIIWRWICDWIWLNAVKEVNESGMWEFRLLIWFATFSLFAKPHFQTINADKCIEKHILSDISDYFADFFLTDSHTPDE